MIPFIDGSEDMEELEYTNREAEIIASSKPRRPSESSTLPNSKACQILGINTRSTFDQDSDSDEGDQTDHSSSSNHHGTIRSKSPSFMSTFSKRLHKKSPSIGGSSNSSFRRGASIDDHDGYGSSFDEYSGSSVRSSEDSLLGGLFRRNSKDQPKTAERIPQRSSSMQRQVSSNNPVRKSHLIDTRAAISAGWMRGPAEEWPYRPRKKGSKPKNVPSILPPSYNPSKSLIPASSPALTAEFTDLYRDETDCEDEAEWALTAEDHSGSSPGYEQLSRENSRRKVGSKGAQRQHKRTFSTDDESNASFSSKSSQQSTKPDFERFSSGGSSTSHTSGVPSLIGSSEKHDSFDSSSVWSCTTGRSSKMETIASPFDLRRTHQYSPPVCPPPKAALPAIPVGEKAWRPKASTPPLLHSISSTKRAIPKKSHEKEVVRPILLKANENQDIIKIRNENAHTPRIRSNARCAKKEDENGIKSEAVMDTLPKFITTHNPRHAIIECQQDTDESDGEVKNSSHGIPRPAPSPPDGSGAVVRTHQPAIRNLPAIVTTRASTPAVSMQTNPIDAEQEKDVGCHKKEQDRMETLFSGTQDSPDERLPEERKAAFETAVRRLDGDIPDQAVTEEGVKNLFDTEATKEEKEEKEFYSNKSGQDQEDDNVSKHDNDVPSPDTVARMVEQLLEEVPCSPLGKTISQIIEDENISSPTEPSLSARADSPTYEASISSAMTDSSLVPSYYLRSPSLPSSGEESGFVLTFEAEETPMEEKLEQNVIEEKPEQEAIAEEEEEKRKEEEKQRLEIDKTEEQESESTEKQEKEAEEESNTGEDNEAIHEQIHNFLQSDETPSFEYEEYEKKRKSYSMISLKSPLLPEVECVSLPKSPLLQSTVKQGEEETDSKDSLSQRHGFSTPLHLIEDKITFDGDYDAPSLSSSSSSPTSSETSSNMEQIAEEDRAIRTVEDALDQILSDLPPMCLKTIEPLSPLRLLDGTIPSAPNTPNVNALTPNTAYQQSFPKSPAPKALNVYKGSTQYSSSLSRPRPNRLLDPTTPRSLFPRGPITPRSPKPRREAPLPIESHTPIDDTPMQLEMDFDASPMSMAAFIPSDSPFKKQDLIPSSPFPTPLPDWPETPMVRDNVEEQDQTNVQSPIPFLPQLSKVPERIPLPRSPLSSEIPLPKSPKPSTKMTLDSLKPRTQAQSSTLQIPNTACELHNHSTLLTPAKDAAVSAPCSPRSPLSLRALRSAKPVEQHPIKNEQNTEDRKLYLASSPSMNMQSVQKPAMFVPSSLYQLRNIPAPLVSIPKTNMVSKSTTPIAHVHSPSIKPPRTPKSPKRNSNVQCSTPLTPKVNEILTKRYVLPI
ncbi:hypothetical protein L7F22_043576 [Adiantum nelumboides]|nr:hypothetical protein [Adiantum nelumboides]